VITIKEYLKVASIKEAWELNQKRTNLVIGGMGWIKMASNNYTIAIDLSDLGLDKIEEKNDEFVIGAMVTLRQLEINEGLNSYFNGAFKDSLRHIVGVQFRNCASLGGTIALRPGFSDPITLFMALDSYVELYNGSDSNELVSLADFCQMKRDNSIVVALHIKKDNRKVVYESFRNTETDFPVLALALAKNGDSYVAAVGARPSIAKRVEGENIEELIEKAGKLSYQSNLRGSAEYRKMLAGNLIKRAKERLSSIE